MTTCETCQEVEKALKRIKFACKAESGSVTWGWSQLPGTMKGYLSLRGSFTTGDIEPILCELPCQIPRRLNILADKVDPPKPKEREWRVGDRLRSTLIGDEDEWVITKIVPAREFPVQVIQLNTEQKNGLSMDSNWHNLTIKDEQAEGG